MAEKIRILHVDDDPDFVDMAATFLEREDDRFDVEIATSASEGLDRLATDTVDCIVSDYDMPGQNGIEFLEAVRGEDPDLPFILYTGKGSEEVAGDAISSGVTDYLQKGSGTGQYELLANRISNAVEQYQANRRAELRHQAMETANEGLSLVRPDGTFSYVNSAFAQLFGYEPDELIGEHWTVLYHNEAAERLDNDILPAVMEHGYWSGETVRLTKDGDRLVTDHRLSRTAEDVIVCTAQDVTPERTVSTEQPTELEFLIDTIEGHAFYTLDHEGYVTSWNEGAERLTGYSATEILGKHVGLFFTEEDRDRGLPEELIETAKTDGTVTDQGWRVRKDDSQIRTADTISASYDASRTIRGFGVMMRESTADPLAEELHRKTDYLDVIMEDSVQPLFMKDTTGEYLLANREYKQLFDIQEEDVIGRTDYELHPDEMAEEVWGNDRQVLETEEPMEIEERVIVDGEERIYLSLKMPVYFDDESDDPDAVFGMATDITERKEHQRILENREQILRSAYEIIADTDRSVSQKIDALLAVGRDHIGTDYATFSHIDGDQYEFEATATAPDADLEAGETTALNELPTCERVFQSSQPLVLNDIEAEAPELVDPAWGIVCYLGAPVVVNDEVYGTFCFYDVEPRTEGFSDWEQTFVELLSDWVSSALTQQQVHDRLQRQNRRLDEFASVVSHDLGNPLNVAEGHLELARETGESEHFDAAQRALDRLDALIEDLATVMREGQLTNELTDVDLETVAQSCWETLDTDGASVVFEETRLIRADENALTRLFENLIRNAVEHGGEDVTVRIGMLPHGFFVEDDGAGISEDEREDIFKPGFTTKEDGTGFGMVSVRQIALAHGWDVTAAESSEGGARFEFTGVELVAE